MFPDADRSPAVLGQAPICIRVSTTIGFDLVSPELGVLFRPRSMYWASVPEATIDKYGDLSLCKSKVSTTTQARNYDYVHIEWHI